MAKVNKQKIRLLGGPWDKQEIYVANSTPATLPFTIKGQTGYYDSEGVWVPKDKGIKNAA